MSVAADVQITERNRGVEFAVKVVPGSSRSQIVGVWETALRVAVAAPPEGGQANKRVIQLLADTFAVKRGKVAITRGPTHPVKRVRIEGISAAQARRVLVAVLDAAGQRPGE